MFLLIGWRSREYFSRFRPEILRNVSCKWCAWMQRTNYGPGQYIYYIV